MFDNIGGKIKAFAKVMCWLGIVVSVLGGIGTMLSDEDMIIFGILIIIGGALFSWVGSFMTYGFGELIDNSAKIRDELAKMEK